MSDAAVKLVVFDLGRVLVKLGDNWPHTCTLAGLTPPAALEDEAVMRQVMAAMVAHETGRLADDDYFARIGGLTGLTPAQVRDVAMAWLVEPFADMTPIVESLISQPAVRTACLSNTNALHWRMMHEDPRVKLPLARLDHAFASHLIGVMKPDAAIYAHVESQARCEPSSILFFDDHAPNVSAAGERGWQAVLIDTTQPSPAAQVRDELARRGVRV